MSYLIAVVGAFSSIVFGEHMHAACGRRKRIIMHAAAAFAFGSGVWSMHFLGMLAYHMDMSMTYSPGLTALSKIIAVCTAGLFFQVINKDELKRRDIVFGAIILGMAISSMHYVGMEAMKESMNIRGIDRYCGICIGGGAMDHFLIRAAGKKRNRNFFKDRGGHDHGCCRYGDALHRNGGGGFYTA
jgi:hypothetical protein